MLAYDPEVMSKGGKIITWIRGNRVHVHMIRSDGGIYGQQFYKKIGT